MPEAALSERIDHRTAKVGVVGLGYVGLPLALHALDAGYEVTGIEVDEERLAALRAGHTYVTDIDDEKVASALSGGRFTVTDDYSVVGNLDIIVVAVPTPLTADVPDLSYVLTAAGSIAEHLRPGTLISLESTTFPGTTEEIVRPRLERSGLTAGADFWLVFSPERIDPGNTSFELGRIPKLIGGLTPSCTDLGRAFYSTIVSTVKVVSRPREAEMAKLLENTYRQVNIALANEFAMVANELDIDIWEVIEAAATKPFGFEAFYPGIGIGGHCIAVDPVYLTWRIRELGRAPFRLVELAREVDDSMPTYVAKRIRKALMSSGLLLKGARVLVLGVTYKPDVADTRESRALEVMERLIAEGAHVSFHDPLVEEVRFGEHTVKRTVVEEGLAEADLVAILTHHSSYAWDEIVDKANLVFDARGVTRGMGDGKITRL